VVGWPRPNRDGLFGSEKWGEDISIIATPIDFIRVYHSTPLTDEDRLAAALATLSHGQIGVGEGLAAWDLVALVGGK
jgi:hypothetical protein